MSAKFEIANFRKDQDEPFYEAWERLLRKCPNHGFEDIDQLNIFCNSLRLETKMLLDAIGGGTTIDAGGPKRGPTTKAMARQIRTEIETGPQSKSILLSWSFACK